MSAFAPVGALRASEDAPAGRLRASADVARVFAARTAARRGPVVVHSRDRGDAAPARVTVVAGRSAGNAVQRNRIKRRLRAAVAAASLAAGFDYVIVGRAPAARIDAAQLRAAVADAAAEVSRR